MLEGRGASSSSAPEAQLGATHPALGLPRNGCDNSRVRRTRLGLHLEMVLEEDSDGRGGSCVEGRKAEAHPDPAMPLPIKVEPVKLQPVKLEPGLGLPAHSRWKGPSGPPS